MKYLKKIFENDLYNTDINISELIDFCETNLAYLLDNTKFKLEFLESPQWNLYCIWLSCHLEDRRARPFKWVDIKDYYIPFIIMLSKQYDLNNKMLDKVESSIIINFMSGSQLFIKVSEIEDWGDNLKNQPDLHQGKDIKEIGVAVNKTIKI